MMAEFKPTINIEWNPDTGSYMVTKKVRWPMGTDSKDWDSRLEMDVAFIDLFTRLMTEESMQRVLDVLIEEGKKAAKLEPDNFGIILKHVEAFEKAKKNVERIWR
jgi:hypothetical protein